MKRRLCLVVTLFARAHARPHASATMQSSILRTPAISLLRRLALPVGVGLLVGLIMAVLDLTLFRSGLPDSMLQMIHDQTITQRLGRFLPMAALDEIIFRLVLVSAAVWILRKFCPADVAWKISIAAIALAYIPLHPAYVQSLGALTPLVVAREIIEHIGAGIVWGILFWKRGLAASMAGHMSAHVPIQLGWALLV